jgi:pimeloyl-ACP methyl ester carboxylesterase
MSIYPAASVSSHVKNSASGSLYKIYQTDSYGPASLDCWLAMPENLDPTLPPLLAIHGVLRDAKGMVNEIAAQLVAGGRMVIAPAFDEPQWHGYQRVIGKRRADLALLSLLKTIKMGATADIRSVDLLGYSGGAQFAHRFALLYPHLIHRLALCSSGWYTFPDDAPYPYGLSVPKGGLPGFTNLTRRNIGSFLRLPIDVYVGERDTEIDPNTRTGKVIDRQQGRNRMERAKNWVHAINGVAAAYGQQPKVKLTVLKGCGHDFRACVRQGKLIERFFSGSMGAQVIAET